MKSQSLFFRSTSSNNTSHTSWKFLRLSITLIRSLIIASLPRYMLRNGLQPTKKEHITSYLDALRGWAALIVLHSHYNPFGKTWLMNQPGFIILTAGQAMVTLFFAISGYVLSYRMLKLMRTHQAEPLLNACVSSVFRRYIRLFGSAGVASFLAMLTIAFGWPYTRIRKPTLVEQIWDWFLDFIHLSNLMPEGIEGYYHKKVFTSKYLEPLWTIPVEFRGSMVLFIYCVAVCKLSNTSRMLLTTFMIFMSYVWSLIYIALFLGGLLLADMSFSRHPERVGFPAPLGQNAHAIKPTYHLSLRKKVLYSIICFIGLFLIGSPRRHLDHAFWPWPLINKFTPPHLLGKPIEEQFWLSIGSLLLIFALDCYPALQTPLKWKFSRYLGDLSFGIYVIHVPILVTLRARVLLPMKDAYLGEALWTHMPVLIIVWATVLWAADLFVRVDDKVVKFGKWLQDRLFTW